MARVEDLTRSFKMGETSVCQGVPVTWVTIPVVEEHLQRMDPSILQLASHSLVKNDIPYVGLHLFDDNESDVLGRLAEEAGGKKVDSVRVGHLQAGNRAYILLCEAVIDRKSYPFVATVSKGPRESSIGKENEQDYRDLSLLAEQFDAHLAPSARSKYSVVKPIAQGKVQAANGEVYPYYVAPFIPMGELRMDIVSSDSAKKTASIPWYRYAVNYNGPMAVTETRLRSNAESLKRQFLRLVRKYPQGGTRFFEELEQARPFQILRSQRNDILTGMALIHKASGGRVPKGWHINAGDWMADLSRHDNIALTLITVREGFGLPLDAAGWKQYIRSHTEPIHLPGQDPLRPSILYPFAQVPDTELDGALNRAKELLPRL